MVEKVSAELNSKMDVMDILVAKRIADMHNDIDLKTGMRWAGWKANTVLKSAAEYFMFDFENGIEPDVISSQAYGYTGAGKNLSILP